MDNCDAFDYQREIYYFRQIMRKITYIIAFIILGAITSTSFSSCKTGYGCPAEEAYEKSKDRPLKSTKRGKSKLFKNSK